MISDGYNLKKPAQTFLTNVSLTILEYILEVGIDEAIDKVADTPDETLNVFPHVKKAIEKRANGESIEEALTASKNVL